MAIEIKSGASADIATIDAVSKALRVTQYKTTGLLLYPEYSGIYCYSLADQAGQTGAYNFLSLWNPNATPLGYLLMVVVEDYSIAAAATKNSLHLTRLITSISGGAAQAASTVNKFDSVYADPSLVIYITNPTDTLGTEITAFGPNQAITAAGSTAVSRRIWQPPAPILLRQNQGVGAHITVAGDADQTYNITFVWGELAA